MERAQAFIPLQNSNADIMLLSSDTDAIWPSDMYAQEAEEYLIKQGKEACVESHCYHESGHMLTIPYQPIPNCVKYGGTSEVGVEATIDAWDRTLKHFTYPLSKSEISKQFE